ncbi:MAG: chitobiase/beta-hexosaminidase C-terminal domain-containing protein [Bacteroidaceae bacterium]|nr:chitobiase/beta-hexosaminidase C-terminal domain-containing protein [Bacteroidaceae bacterium]
MKRYIYYVLISLLLPLSMVAQTGGYDPVNPPDPNWPGGTEKYYQVIFESIPYGAGRFSINSYSKFKEGETVSITAYNHDDCYFICWKDVEGNEVTTDPTLVFTMPASDVKYYAIYSYDPANPANPEVVNHYMLSIRFDPEVAGYSNFKDQKVAEGSTQSLYAYINSGFRFLYWKDADGIILGTDQQLNYLMPSHASTLTACYEYNPEDPMQPGTNVWDKDGGELIVDYFKTGSLLSAMDNMVGGSSNRDKVTHFVVDGEINGNDWGFPYYYKNLTYIDFSHAFGVDAVPARWLENYTDIQEVELPSCITRIGAYAFRGCSSMRAIDCYATVPPVVEDGAFDGLPAEMVVYVPEESISLYEAASPWNTFTISPLKSKICTLEVCLPDECKDGRYKNASLEVLNVKSGQRYKYVISDRLNYTFTNLIRGTKQKVYVKNLTGHIIYESDVIDIDEEHKQLMLSGMKMPYDVTMVVRYENGTDITNKVNITWTTSTDVFICEGAKVEGQLEGALLKYSISVPADIAAEYYAPESSSYIVKPGTNTVTVTLHPIPSVQCSGVVVDFKSAPVKGAQVVFEQQTGGGTVSVSTETDAQGKFSLTAKLLPTTVRISSNYNINQVREYTKAELEALVEDGKTNFGKFDLLPLGGEGFATVHPLFKYTQATSGEPTVSDYFPYKENVSYTFYNKTTGQDLTELEYKTQFVYIRSGAHIGDEIQATCSSTNGKFAPVTLTKTMVKNTALTYVFPVIEYGKVYARFLVTDNNAVEGMLYDAAGHLVRHETYNTNFTPTESDELGDLLDHNKTPNFIYLSDLPAGDYTLITMGKSSFFGTLSNLSGYADAGMEAGVDYVRNDFTVKDGEILPIRNVVIPVFDESKYYYTGQNTKFSVNKANIVEGNYLTLSAKVDFQDEYKLRVSNVELVFNLHPTCPMVESSVVVGNRQGSYEYKDNTVTVQLGENFTDRVKFCIAPTSRGNYSPDAYVRFELDGTKTVLQPIGSVNYTVTDVSIWTAPLISLPSIFVDGNAAGMSEVIIYDKGKELGRTKALADGYWSFTANLTHCVNLSIHEIQAKVTSPSGLVRQTEMRPVEYNEAGVQAKDVDMRFYGPGRTVWVDFDLEHVKANVKSYSFVPNTEFVFTANLTNNDPNVVHSCVIHVFTIEHEWIDLEAQYIPNMDRWVAHSKFGSNQAPMAVRVTVDADLNPNVPYEEIQLPEPEKHEIPDNYDVGIPSPNGVGYNIIYTATGDYVADPDKEYGDPLTINDENGDEQLKYETDEDGNVLITDNDLGEVVQLDEWQEDEEPALVRPYKAPIATESVTRLKERIVALETGISLVNGFITNPNVAQEKLEIVRSLNTLTRYLHDGIKDVNAWQEFISRLQPCEGLDDPQAKAMLWISEEYKNTLATRYLSCCKTADAAAMLLMAKDLHDANDILAKYLANVSFAIYKAVKTESRNELRRSKRLRNQWDCSYASMEEIDDVWDASLPYPIVEPIIDPSGYVYEGVPSNRLEGVTATAYYKHTYEDEYGDLQQEIVLWDASQYSQENPLYTNEEGLYQWDVPQGLWQVKFEKAGYQTTYSDWLPVPPPQMDVNIGMVQATQPEVISAKAYEAGETTEGSVVITFDKYMKPSTLTPENIFIKGIKNNEETLLEAGEFTFPDAEAAIEGSDDTFATKVSIATTDLSTFDEVRLIVDRAVESYAGINMTEVFQQKLDIEKKLTGIVVDPVINIGYGSTETVRIAAVPTIAAAGKKVVITSASTLTANIGGEGAEQVTVTLDADGQAEIDVNGVLYGTTALTMEVVGEDVTATAMVSVVDPELLEAVKAPVASRLSGTQLYQGQTVTLTCESKGATIYYTTDGTCPCDSPTRQLYSKPIPVNEDMTLKIMAVSYQGEESEINEYHYTIRQSEVQVDLVKGWNWASHDLATPLAVSALDGYASVVLTQGSEPFVTATQSMKIAAEKADVLTFDGPQYNPTLDDVVLSEGWNWLGYPLSQMLTLEDALSFLYAEEGDVISNLEDGFSVYTDGQWVGDIETLRPGQGYMYKSQSQKAFVYNTVPTVNARALFGKHAKAQQNPWSVNQHGYADMMCIIATIEDEGYTVGNSDWIAGAFVNDECRGVGRFIGSELFLPVRGKEGDEITITIVSLSDDAGSDVKEHPAFVADMLGTVAEPVVFTLTDPTSIESLTPALSIGEGAIYNVAGQRLSKMQKGVNIVNGKKIIKK